jgi:hypothetical protein
VSVAVAIVSLIGGARAVAAAASQPQAVTIATEGTIVEGSQSGTFSAAGAVVDEGTFSFHEEVHKDFAFAALGAPTFGIVRSAEFFVVIGSGTPRHQFLALQLFDAAGEFHRVGGEALRPRMAPI